MAKKSQKVETETEVEVQSTKFDVKAFTLNFLKYILIFSVTVTTISFSLKAVYAYFNEKESLEKTAVNQEEYQSKNNIPDLPKYNSVKTNSPYQSSTKDSTDKYIKKLSDEEFYSSLSYSYYHNMFYIAGNNGYSQIYLEPILRESAEAVISGKTLEKLIDLKALFEDRENKFKTLLPDKNIYISHVGVSFKSGDKLKFINTLLGESEVTLPNDINLEVGKIMYSGDKVYLGLANTFTGNGRTFGDIFVPVDIDTAIKKITNSSKVSVVVTDVQYWWDKSMNIIAGANYSKNNPLEIKDTVDVNFAIGTADPYNAGFVAGQAILSNEVVNGVLGGGVCHWATVWNTTMRMGLDAYGIKYKVLKQDMHTDVGVRYIPNTVYPYLDDDIFFYDVTVYYSSEGSVGSITEIEKGKSMKIKVTPLIEDPTNARFLAIVEAVPVKM